eukprot:111600-Prorocentrum_minimum.AAC.1
MAGEPTPDGLESVPCGWRRFTWARTCSTCRTRGRTCESTPDGLESTRCGAGSHGRGRAPPVGPAAIPAGGVFRSGPPFAGGGGEPGQPVPGAPAVRVHGAAPARAYPQVREHMVITTFCDYNIVFYYNVL